MAAKVGATPINAFLAVVGVLMLVVGAVGFLLRDDTELANLFVFLGVVVCVIAVVVQRLEGRQTFALDKVELNLAKALLSEREAEVERGEVKSLKELE